MPSRRFNKEMITKKVYRFAVPLRFIEYFEIDAETLNEAECILTKKVQTEDKSDWNFDYMSASVDYPNINYIVKKSFFEFISMVSNVCCKICRLFINAFK